MARNISVIDSPDQTLTVDLDGNRYGLRLRYNDVGGFWTLDISLDDVAVRRGIVLRGGVELTKGLACLPDEFGAFMHTVSGLSTDARADLPTGLNGLYYLSPPERDIVFGARA